MSREPDISDILPICTVCDCVLSTMKNYKKHLKSYKHLVLSHGGTLDNYHEMLGCQQTINYITNRVEDINTYNYKNWLRNKKERLEYLEKSLGIKEEDKIKKKKKYIDSEDIIGW